ncbi:MAG: alpha/beta hydrolase [Flaviaesturariibacter sp.]|nr:alpha/beta hydrolase [Flaviaesturariibacter sp.]
METRNLLYKNAAISYRVQGAGETVVLLHGFGEDGTIWKHQYNAFAGYRLLIPDLPGSGASAMVEEMSLEGLAEVVHTILEAESVNQCIMIGHSMGGYITLAFAERYPQLLSGFGLFHSSAFADSEEKRSTRRKGILFIEEHGAEAFLKATIPNLYSAASKEAHPEWIEEHVSQSKTFSGAALIAYYRSMMGRPDRTAVLREATVPVLFVMGREDAAVPLADGLQQCYLPAQSHVHILEAAGHTGMIEETIEANHCMNSFVNCITKPLMP